MSAENPPATTLPPLEIATLGEEINVARAAFYQMLPVRDFDLGYAWAAYDYHDNEDGSNDAYQDDTRQVLLLADTRLNEGADGPPMVRVATLEPCRDVPAGYLVHDMSIFGNGFAQYLFDLIQLEPDGSIMESVPTQAPLFRIDDYGNLVLDNCQPATVGINLRTNFEGKQVLGTPFGRRYCREDRLFVAKKVQSIVGKLKGLEPRSYGPRQVEE